MKNTHFSILLILFLTQSTVFAQNFDYDSISKNLKLHGEMGYITKEMGFPFLFLNGLIDTTKQSKAWNKITPKDTIGKYFRMDSSDHYLVCMPKTLNSFNPLYSFFEIDSTGKIIKKEIFNLGSYRRGNDYFKNFSKFVDLFSCSINYASFEFQAIDNVYFNQLRPLDSLDKIRVYEWIIYRRLFRNSNKQNTKSYYVYRSKLEKKNDSNYYTLTCYYKLQRGFYVPATKNRESVFKLYPYKRIIKVKYIIQDNKIETKDQFKLKKIKRFIKISSKRVII